MRYKVGGRGGASGGRGRLRLRALNGLVTLFSTPGYLLTRCGGLQAPPLPPTSFFGYWFPSYMELGTVPKGFEKYGGWGEACTLPIDARTCISIDLNWFSWISEGFEGLAGWGEACTSPIDARTCISVHFH